MKKNYKWHKDDKPDDIFELYLFANFWTNEKKTRSPTIKKITTSIIDT